MIQKGCPVLVLVSLLISGGLMTLHAQSEIQATVIAQSLNVRAAPNAQASILGQYTYQTVVRVVGRDGTPGGGVWVYVIPLEGSLAGWVLSDYLEFPAGFELTALLVLNAETAATPIPVTTSGEAITAVTAQSVNFRTGPGMQFPVIRLLAEGTPVMPTGRSADGAWVQASVDDQSGWLSASLIHLSADVSSLPVVENPVPSVLIPAGVVPTVSAHARQIYLKGRSMGNNPRAFSKIGDSITHTPEFLFPIGGGFYDLGDYSYLQPVISYFSWPANSFGRYSVAARAGWTSFDLLTPGFGDPAACGVGETPLECEYRLFKPAVALIMIGTNDVAKQIDSDSYHANLERIVQISLDRGVIPVLSTIPDNLTYAEGEAQVLVFNAVVASVAAQYDIPLWDYWLAMQDLPNKGMDTADNFHPSFDRVTDNTTTFTPEWLQYGYTMRNLTALMVLDAVWQGAMY